MPLLSYASFVVAHGAASRVVVVVSCHDAAFEGGVARDEIGAGVSWALLLLRQAIKRGICGQIQQRAASRERSQASGKIRGGVGHQAATMQAKQVAKYP